MRLAATGWLLLAGGTLLAAPLWWLRRRWQRFPLPGGGRERRRCWPDVTTATGLLAALAFVPLAVATARPQEVLSRKTERTLGIDIVVVLDVSTSMAALDFKPTNRLGCAKEVVQEFVASRSDDRIGLVSFAGTAVTLCPLTLDHQVVQQLLAGVELGVLPDGTAIGLGLGTAVNRLRSSDASSRVIVLVTDGANNAGQLDPLNAAELAVAEGITVHTVLVGTGGRVPIPVPVRDPHTGGLQEQVRRLEVEVNPDLLQRISSLTGGVAFRARNPQALARVFAKIDAMEKSELTATRLVRYRERFEPWLWIALGLLMGAVAGEAVGGGTPW